MDVRQEELRGRLKELGFDDVRFAALSALPPETLRPWLADGMQGEMVWMERTAEKRLQPDLVLSGAKSVIMLGISYAGAGERREGRPVWARYAMHEDYHETIKPALVAAGKMIEEIFKAGSGDYRYYVDTGPVLERAWAARAGIGFVGKNAMMISRRHGNWLLLAAILMRVEFLPDEPIRKKTGGPSIGLLCGKCTRCLDACPTGAFPRPGVVDARRCISYQTIENKGVIPRELRAGIGNRIYGCDVCLEVCPWNRFARAGRGMLLAARGDLTQLTLAEILGLDAVQFTEIFRRTPIKRLKLVGLLRNACVVAGNSGDVELMPQLLRLAQHELALVRAHAVWAVMQLGGADKLGPARAVETDPIVLTEYAAG